MAEKTWNEAVAALTGAGSPFEIVEDGALKRFKNVPPTLRQLFDGARERGEETFLVYEDEQWSFRDAMARVDEIAALLVDRYGVSPGDRVAIASRNYPEWICAFAAATSVGGVAVCMNAWWTPDEIAYGLEDSGASVLIADRERAERAVSVLPSTTRGVLIRGGDGETPEGFERLEDVLTPGAAMPEAAFGADSDATILYTSGTTGRPKGAVSTHGAVLNALTAFACRAMVNMVMRPPAEPHPYPTSFILVVPLFHVTGLVPVMLSCFAAGYKLVMMYKWVPERALELIERERITTFVGVPTMSWDLLESPEFAQRDTSFF
ncbi:MAG: class I adenylate-forming enzyme family protein [Myxococcota bacterium]